MLRRHAISRRQLFSAPTRWPRPRDSRTSAVRLIFLLVLSASALALTTTPQRTFAASAATSCVGDCDRNGEVTVDELLAIVDVALGNAPIIGRCPAGDADGNGVVQITEVIAAVGGALNGCVPEAGWCYESSNCSPSDVYPSQPFATGRGFCCHLALTIVGGTFSWCPADMFDPSSGSCLQCVFPC